MLSLVDQRARRYNSQYETELMSIPDVEQMIDQALDGAYVNGECVRNKWKICRCVSVLIAHYKK